MRRAAIVALLCAAYLAQALWSAWHSSATYDEPAHLAAGYTYLTRGDFRLNPEHPPVVKALAALPLLWFYEPIASRAQSSSAQLEKAFARGIREPPAQWTFGQEFFYGLTDAALFRLKVEQGSHVPPPELLAPEDFAQDARLLFFVARAVVALLGLLLALLVFAWAFELFGFSGALWALALVCLDPNFVAHGALVTTDLPMAAFSLGTVYFLWRSLRRLSVLNALGFCAFFALAIAAKFTAVLLPAIVALCLLAHLVSSRHVALADGRRLEGARRLGALLTLVLLAGLTSFGLLWASYGGRFAAGKGTTERFAIEPLVQRTAALSKVIEGFDFQTRPFGPGEAEIDLALAGATASLSGKAILFAARHEVLPEAYLQGLAFAGFKSQLRESFLFGRWSLRGFGYYFPAAIALKTPLPTLAAIAAALILLLGRRRPRPLFEPIFLLVPVLVFGLAAMFSNLNIGHRHVLHLYPFLFVACAALAEGWQRWAAPKKRLLAGAPLGVLALGTLLSFAPPWRPSFIGPHYLSYFNELSGGPAEGYRSLGDSNLDWGQELYHLRDWLSQHEPGEVINLLYFGSADPRAHQVLHINVLGGHPAVPYWPLQPGVSPLEYAQKSMRIPGLFVVSATHLQGIYLLPEERQALRSWLTKARLIDRIGNSLFVFRLEALPE